MKIYAKIPNWHPIYVVLPNALFTGRFAQKIIKEALSQKKLPENTGTGALDLSKLDLKPLTREIRRIKRTHRKFYLVELEAADGTVVKISL